MFIVWTKCSFHLKVCYMGQAISTTKHRKVWLEEERGGPPCLDSFLVLLMWMRNRPNWNPLPQMCLSAGCLCWACFTCTGRWGPVLGAALGGSLSPQGHTCTLQVACGYAGAMEKERWHAQLTEAIQAAKRERQGRTALPMSFKDRPLHWTCKQAIATGKILPIVFNEMQIKVMTFFIISQLSLATWPRMTHPSPQKI